MAAADRIRDLLPSLWRPEPGGSDLLSALLGASGQGLDRARIEAGDTMQAHWVRFADSALLSPFVAASRREAGERPLLPGAPEVAAHPYLDDLARLAALLDLAPFTEPLDGRERVEDFRARILGTMALWKEGVGTRAAILGAARLALSGLPERAVQVEEFAPGAAIAQPVATEGAPDGMVGPLMRWRVESRALLPTAPVIEIEGVAPVAGRIDPTTDPLIELFDPATGTGRGLAYEGTVAPGQVLALLPAYASWLGAEGGALAALALPGADGTPADPTAAGPWAAATDGAPALPVRGGFAETADATLWAGFEEAGTGTLARLGAGGWTVALDGLPVLGALLTDGMDLLIGHANGLSRLDALDPDAVPVPDPAAGTGPAVAALARDPAGRVWAATARGAAAVGSDDTLTLVGPGARAETETPLVALAADPGGLLHLGGPAGLFRFDPTRGSWHVYRGGAIDEAVPDWAPWDPAADPLPADAEVFLPGVTALCRGPDASLWIGTEAGLARYRARGARATYATRLEAFPELGTGPVHALAIDERQRLWAGTARGLLVHDGFDWFQARGGALARLPRPARPADLAWRFDRASGAWQSARAGGAAGFQSNASDPITTEEPAVTAIAWTDMAIARLGSRDAGGRFQPDPEAVPGPLRARLKPTPDRILDGPRPVLPRLPPGPSDWRYLALEEPAPPVPRAFPAWTREGRLLPPPEEAAAPAEGRFLAAAAIAELDRVFAYDPAARVTFRWQPRAALSITVRLARETSEEVLPAPVLDRVFDAVQRVRPAGARVVLAHGETVVRGGDVDG